ncbi:hypothetical protein EYF80_026987 [Liparis tanakae]|uniref:Uncharacterized protein n=1 Tax=Liparis tanakae TaxID=230148 RepID=A0A4Z2HAW8_9TELE|nr:hypothetical protein EYF80_026987 [Liparis tanakae]
MNRAAPLGEVLATVRALCPRPRGTQESLCLLDSQVFHGSLLFLKLILPPASCLLPPASCLLPPAFCLLPPVPWPCTEGVLLPPWLCLMSSAS